MSSITSTGRRPKRLTGDQGASLVEYALLISLILLVCLSAVTYFGNSTSKSLSKSASSLGTAGS